MALPAEKPRYTYADILVWEDVERVEIIDGELVMFDDEATMMAPPPSSTHQEISMELAFQLHAYLKGKRCKVLPAPFAVRLFELDGDSPEDMDTVVEPDISVICDPGKIDKKGCKGAPDMVVEILSPSTLRHDRFTKFSLYQRAGVREYWIVDPDSKTAQSFILEDGRYSVKEFGTVGDKMKVNVLEDCVIDLSEVFSE